MICGVNYSHLCITIYNSEFGLQCESVDSKKYSKNVWNSNEGSVSYTISIYLPFCLDEKNGYYLVLTLQTMGFERNSLVLALV